MRHTHAMEQPQGRGPIEVTVEIPSGSRNKYEYDHARHRFVLDRVLYSSVHYPCDYGFIEGSLAEDGDPLDVLVIIAEPTFPGCVVRARPVGVLDMADEKGHDYKILAVAHDDPRWEEMFRRLVNYARQNDVEVYSWNGGNHWFLHNYAINHVPGFILAQLFGAGLSAVVCGWLFGDRTSQEWAD